MLPIEISNLSFSYGKKEILKNANLTIERSDFAYIVGRNGSGKSTLVKLILGLLPYSAGRIKIFGLPPYKGRRLIGYTPQHMQFDPQFPATVREVIMMGRMAGYRLFYNKEDHFITDQIMEKMELSELQHQEFSALSGGQRQRTLIARALATKPGLLLLDEPTANIDEYSEQQLFKTLSELNKELPIIMVSHDLYFTQEVVNKVICLHTKDIQTHRTSGIPLFIREQLQLGNFKKIEHSPCCQEDIDNGNATQCDNRCGKSDS